MNINKSITSMDAAKLAQVSQSSVSRVFNPNSKRSVKPEIREKMLKASAELGYKPNFIARSMISKRTGIVSLVIISYRCIFTMPHPTLTNIFRGQILWQGAHDRNEDLVYKLKVSIVLERVYV